MTSVFNTDASLPYNHELFERLIVNRRIKVDGEGTYNLFPTKRFNCRLIQSPKEACQVNAMAAPQMCSNRPSTITPLPKIKVLLVAREKWTVTLDSRADFKVNFVDRESSVTNLLTEKAELSSSQYSPKDHCSTEARPPRQGDSFWSGRSDRYGTCPEDKLHPDLIDFWELGTIHHLRMTSSRINSNKETCDTRSNENVDLPAKLNTCNSTLKHRNLNCCPTSDYGSWEHIWKQLETQENQKPTAGNTRLEYPTYR
ncbi:hypothetical protein CSKR_109199 [Clonorchis sinensis]|uniref:Uncharacterized protein n=1 Tax=Clonorchis sinensis TaxID=79923 RepID=A0A3R7GLH4_CLOSI|nr:hypothetical protein CSKR_109199 [Clonorchis sinensis]